MYISAINTAPEFENKSNQAQIEIPEMIQHQGSSCVNLWIRRISYICGITAILLLILITIIALFIETQNSMASYKHVENGWFKIFHFHGVNLSNLLILYMFPCCQVMNTRRVDT